MSFDTGKLDASELFHLAFEAANRDDHAQAISCLKAAAAMEQPAETLAKTTFFLASEYAQIGMFDRAEEHMEKAVALDTSLHIAQFQLGLLHLTSGRAQQARESWARLALLDENAPEFFLKHFKQGLEALADDDFSGCRYWIGLGMASNQTNPALNADMQKVLDALPAADSITTPMAKSAEEDKDKQADQQHLFLSAYRDREIH